MQTGERESSFFARSLALIEVNLNSTFTSSTPMAIEVSRQMYNKLVTDDSNLQKVLLPEYLDDMAEAREFKPKCSLQLTLPEQDLVFAESNKFTIHTKKFNIFKKEFICNHQKPHLILIMF